MGRRAGTLYEPYVGIYDAYEGMVYDFSKIEHEGASGSS